MAHRKIDRKASATSLRDAQLDGIGGGSGLESDCGVAEEAFPQAGKCCSKSTSLAGTVYRQSCPCCSLWSSLPDGASLEVTYIVECTLYGYGKRIKA